MYHTKMRQSTKTLLLRVYIQHMIMPVKHSLWDFNRMMDMNSKDGVREGDGDRMHGFFYLEVPNAAIYIKPQAVRITQ